MQEQKVRIKKLLSEYTKGTIKEIEFNELQDYLSRGSNDAELNSVFDELFQEMELDPDLIIQSNVIYDNVAHHPDFNKGTRKSYRGKLWWFTGAAAAIVFVAFKLFLSPLPPLKPAELHQDQFVSRSPNQVEPTAKKATLRLADGTEINLDQSKDGIISIENNMQISLKGSTIHYENPASLMQLDKNAMNTISTAKGRQFQVVLPDGTKIWLNALSSLSYPVQFDSRSRNVEVSGEAYFEVNKAEDWPFIVKTATQEISVLGTHFNISAYPDDEVFKTTLLEGKLKVTALEGKTPVYPTHSISKEHSLLLQPGQQALTYKGNGELRRVHVDTEEAVSWKNNLFVFNNEEISEVMKKVMRWYDVEVVYSDGMKGMRIGGSIPRFEKIEQLMEALEATGLLHYKMKGGKVVIMK